MQKEHPKALQCLFCSAEGWNNDKLQLTWSGSCHPISILSRLILFHHFAGSHVCSIFCYLSPLFKSGQTVTRTAGASACLKMSRKCLDAKFWELPCELLAAHKTDTHDIYLRNVYVSVWLCAYVWIHSICVFRASWTTSVLIHTQTDTHTHIYFNRVDISKWFTWMALG